MDERYPLPHALTRMRPAVVGARTTLQQPSYDCESGRRQPTSGPLALSPTLDDATPDNGSAARAMGEGGLPRSQIDVFTAPRRESAYLRVAPLSHVVFREVECRAVAAIGAIQRPALDLGCGTGQFARCALQGTLDAGVDLSARCAARARRTGRYARVVVADAAELPFEDGEFQTVLSVSVLEHMRRPRQVIAEAYRVLRPGGRLVATITLADMHQHLFYPAVLRRLRLGWLGRAYVRAQDWAFTHRTLLSADEWQDILWEAGFKPIECRRILSPRAVRTWDALLPLALPYWLLRPLGVPTILNTRWRTAWARRRLASLERDEEAAADDGAVLLVVAERPED
jgi:SAM-dependent methyltransferase